MAASPIWTPPLDWASGELVTHDKLNTQVRDNAQYLYENTPKTGTAFPASPTTGDRFYRTDLLQDCTYDGARWVGPQQVVTLPLWDASGPYAASIFPLVLALVGAIKIDKFETIVYINAPCDTSRYWRIELWRDSTTIWTATPQVTGFTTSSTTTLGAQTATSRYAVGVITVGSPGSIQLVATMSFRRVYT